MSIVRPIFDNLIGFYSSEELPAKVILAVILAVALLSAYEFAVYRLVSHRAFYDRSYNTRSRRCLFSLRALSCACSPTW